MATTAAHATKKLYYMINSARPAPNSPLKWAVLEAPLGCLGHSPLPGAHEERERGGGGGMEHKRWGKPSGPYPVLAIASSLQLMERGGGDGGRPSVTASMGGTTLLWRDATTCAAALLLWGRGIEVSLGWGGGGVEAGPGGCRSVHRAVFDPLGPNPLNLSPIYLSLPSLQRLQSLRERISRLLAGGSGFITDNSSASLACEVEEAVGLIPGRGLLLEEELRGREYSLSSPPLSLVNIIVRDFGVAVTARLPPPQQLSPVTPVSSTARVGRKRVTAGVGAPETRAESEMGSAGEFDDSTSLLPPLRTEAGDALLLGWDLQSASLSISMADPPPPLILHKVQKKGRLERVGVGVI